MRQNFVTTLLLAFCHPACGAQLRHSAQRVMLPRELNVSLSRGGRMLASGVPLYGSSALDASIRPWTAVLQSNSALNFEMQLLSQEGIAMSAEQLRLPVVQVFSEAGFPTIQAMIIFGIPMMASVSYGLAGVGFAMVFHTMWYVASLLSIFSGNVAEANLVIFVLLPIINVAQFVNLLADVCWRTLALWFFPYNLGFYPGLLLMLWMGESPSMQGILRILVGTLILCSVLFMGLKRYSAWLGSQDEKADAKDYLNDWKLFWGTVAYATLDGVLNGVAGMPGPLQILWVLYMRVPQALWRATGPVCGLFFNILRVPFLMWTGHFDFSSSNFWTIVLLGGSGALTGLAIGNALARCVTQTRFEQLLLCLLVPIALGMLITGGTQMLS
eukprot:gnl/MRDRNA2_/MRDRNA2_57825_c0_seq1.p1 gnl/MRDRNA2_/MRDRNA2_57825_c0~~gnl/MRDRNA2_/MRDRNA2_57825_c0_seq1.p1  ORF type:complete len:385 (-),score=41.45 gnl/MRDRNA2_/MRDRNA2_57825_c0_seq1:247-1401(-)